MAKKNITQCLVYLATLVVTLSLAAIAVSVSSLLFMAVIALVILGAALYILHMNRQWIIAQEEAKYFRQTSLLQQEAREAREYLEQVLFSDTEAIISTDDKANVLIWNRASEAMFGYSRQEVMGRPIEQIMPEISGQPACSSYLSMMRKQGHWEGERWFARRDGTHFLGWLITTVVMDKVTPEKLMGFLCIIRDITKSKQLEQQIKQYATELEKKVEERTHELRESQQLLEEIFENVPLSVVVLDRHGNYLYVNRYWEWINGYSRDKILGQPVHKFRPELVKQENFSQMLQRTFNEGKVTDQVEISYIESRGPYKGRKVFKIFWGIPVLKTDQGVEKAAILSYNATELKQLEWQLIQSEKLAATGKLVAGIAHEINSPIYGIQGCLEHLLHEINLSPEDHRFVEMAYNETKRISGLIRRLQGFYQPTMDAMTPVNINDLLKDVVFWEASSLKQSRIKVSARYAERLPLVKATGDQLKQVFLNLVNNSRDAMPSGGTLTVVTSQDNSYVKIEIIDTGYGIAKEDQDKIFKAFFTTKKEAQGMGLGLSVSYDIIIRHNGKIEVDSEPGKGTKFSVFLPII